MAAFYGEESAQFWDYDDQGRRTFAVWKTF